MNDPADKDVTRNVSNKLKMPEGVGPAGVYEDMTEAYVRSVVAIPAILAGMTESLADIADSLSVLALYLEKKGIVEGTLTNEDLDEGDDNGPDKTA